MYAKDLSPYTLHGFELDGVYCIGWLSRWHWYSRGYVSNTVRQKLTALAWSHPQLKTRGYHQCPLCPWPLGHLFRAKLENDTKALVLGSAEIWVPSADGSRFYSAPDLIVHYIARHRYCPPKEFVAALERFEPHSDWKPRPLIKHGLPAIGNGRAKSDG